MPPRLNSRHTFTTAQYDDDGNLFLSERVPFRFVDLTDNRTHLVAQGDTLFSLAGRYYAGLPRPSGFWWVIADFQPDPIFDPTIELAAGSTIVIPSARTLLESILSEARRDAEEV